jgi:hypothetical protein
MVDSRIRSRRSGAILAAALIAIAAVPGLVTAADSRSLFIGAPDAFTNDGKILPTTVSKPAGAPDNATKFVVQIQSTDNQNLAHTVLTIDANKQGVPGLTYNTIYDPNPNGEDDASTTFCSHVGTLITCDYGSLLARTSRTVAVVVNVTSDFVAPTVQPLFWAKVQTNNENGSNKQVFVAASGPSADDPTPPPAFNVGAFSDNGLNTFVVKGRTGVELSTSPASVNGTAGKVSTAIKFDTTAYEEVGITEGTSSGSSGSLYPCPNLAGLSCQPGYSEVKTTSGFFSSAPYFKWTLTVVVPNSYVLGNGFGVHYLSPTDANPDILYFKNSSSYCPTDPAALAAKIASANWCIFQAPTLAKLDKANSLLTLIVLLNHQGGMKI